MTELKSYRIQVMSLCSPKKHRRTIPNEAVVLLSSICSYQEQSSFYFSVLENIVQHQIYFSDLKIFFPSLYFKYYSSAQKIVSNTKFCICLSQLLKFSPVSNSLLLFRLRKFYPTLNLLYYFSDLESCNSKCPKRRSIQNLALENFFSIENV